MGHYAAEMELDEPKKRPVDRSYAELINLAAEMATGKGLPSFPDGEFYATTPERERRRILKAMANVEERCKEWAVRVRAVADRLSQQHNPQQSGEK